MLTTTTTGPGAKLLANSKLTLPIYLALQAAVLPVMQDYRFVAPEVLLHEVGHDELALVYTCCCSQTVTFTSEPKNQSGAYPRLEASCHNGHTALGKHERSAHVCTSLSCPLRHMWQAALWS